MNKLRIAAVGVATTSALCAAASGYAYHRDMTFEWQILAVMAVSAAVSVLLIYCTTLGIRTLQDTTTKVCDRIAAENRALHRSMVVVMEQYGDSRAVDAVVAAERRRTINERGHDTADLTYLGRVNAGNVTPLRKH